MNFFIIVLAIGLFVSLFSLFMLSRDDLTLLRKDITLDKIFNLFFLVFFVGLLFARILFVLINNLQMFLNPLAFFLFPYFPGLSLAGGVLFGLMFLIFYCRESRFPVGRITDFFSLSFLTSLPFGYLGYFTLTGWKDNASGVLAVLYTILTVIFLRYFYHLLLKGKFKDGSISLIFLFIFSLVSLASGIVTRFANLFFLRQIENYLFLLLLIASIVIFVRQEKLFKPRKR